MLALAVSTNLWNLLSLRVLYLSGKQYVCVQLNLDKSKAVESMSVIQ